MFTGRPQPTPCSRPVNTGIMLDACVHTACGQGRLRGPAVEHWSLADVLSLSCARHVADG